MPTHLVRQGECIFSIADRYGLPWESVWEHERNASFRARSADPSTLLPGDPLFVPERVLRGETCAPDANYRFRRKGVPARFIVQLVADGVPRADQSFTFVVGDVTVEGTSDADGVVSVSVPPGAKEGTLTIGPDAFTLRVLLGFLDPVGTVAGVQARLVNLGFDPGPVNGTMSIATRGAIVAFQAMAGLVPTGIVDDGTRAALAARHDERTTGDAADGG